MVEIFIPFAPIIRVTSSMDISTVSLIIGGAVGMAYMGGCIGTLGIGIGIGTGIGIGIGIGIGTGTGMAGETPANAGSAGVSAAAGYSAYPPCESRGIMNVG